MPLELIGDLVGRDVLEVGAGTGKLTRFLLELGANVHVIEPDEDMRKVLVRQSPAAVVLLGRAESSPRPTLPLTPSSPHPPGTGSPARRDQ